MRFAYLPSFFYFLRMEPATFDQLIWRNVLRIKKTNTNLRKAQIPLLINCFNCTVLACGDKHFSLMYNIRMAKNIICTFILKLCQSIVEVYNDSLEDKCLCEVRTVRVNLSSNYSIKCQVATKFVKIGRSPSTPMLSPVLLIGKRPFQGVVMSVLYIKCLSHGTSLKSFKVPPITASNMTVLQHLEDELEALGGPLYHYRKAS